MWVSPFQVDNNDAYGGGKNPRSLLRTRLTILLLSGGIKIRKWLAVDIRTTYRLKTSNFTIARRYYRSFRLRKAPTDVYYIKQRAVKNSCETGEFK
jgi:hypothetical protein